MAELCHLVLDDEFRCCSRCFHSGVRHEVDDRIVLFVPNARDDRQRELCHVFSQQERVEAREVGCCTATTDDDHGIPLLHFVSDDVEGLDDALLHLCSLHHGRKQLGAECQSVRIVLQLIAEVLVASSSSSRNYGNALQQGRQLDFLVHREDSLILQLLDDFLSALCHVAQGESWVDVDDVERVAVGFVEVDFHFHQHFHSSRKSLPCGVLEVGTNESPFVRPNLSSCLGNDAVVPLCLLHKFHVAVSSVFLHLAQFGS